MLAICALSRSGFNRMVKESKKKAKGGEIEELEVEIESNDIQARVRIFVHSFQSRPQQSLMLYANLIFQIL